MEVLGCRRLVEVKITTKDLVGTLTRKYHLDTHRLDDTRQQIHWRRSTNGGHIISLDEIDHVADGVKPLLDSVVDLMVNSPDMISHEFSLGKIRGTLQTHGKRV